MNNLSSYCGLVNAKIRASDKDLPVKLQLINDKLTKTPILPNCQVTNAYFCTFFVLIAQHLAKSNTLIIFVSLSCHSDLRENKTNKSEPIAEKERLKKKRKGERSGK